MLFGNQNQNHRQAADAAAADDADRHAAADVCALASNRSAAVAGYCCAVALDIVL